MDVSTWFLHGKSALFEETSKTMVLQTTSHGGRNLSSKTQNKTAEETSIILIQKRHKVVY